MTEPHRIDQGLLEAYASMDENGNFGEPCTDLEDAYYLAVEVRDSRVRIRDACREIAWLRNRYDDICRATENQHAIIRQLEEAWMRLTKKMLYEIPPLKIPPMTEEKPHD